MLDFVKSNGKKVSNNISMQELDRLNQITELQNKGVSINDDATFSEIEEAKYGPPKVIHLFTKIVGTTFNTNDGTSRQTNLAKCQSWEKLKLVPEPDNPVDPDAIEVQRQTGESLGHLREELAYNISWRIGKGFRYNVFLKEITGRRFNKPILGANILIFSADPRLSEQQEMEYINNVLAQFHAGTEIINTHIIGIHNEKEFKKVRHLFTKVLGVTEKNVDGTSRQSIISQCRLLETLDLKYEDDNPIDPNAIMVCKLSGEQIGYLNAELAKEVTLNSRQGYHYSTHIMAITGGDKSYPTRGCNLLITVAEPGVSDQQVMDYFNCVIANDKNMLQELGVDSITAILSK
jgi:hypothetical protein